MIGGIFRRRCCTLSGHRDVAPCRIRSPGKRSATGRHTGTLAGRQKRKKPIRQDGLFTCLMPGSLWRASCPPPSGPLLQRSNPPRRICPTLRALTDKQQIKKPGLSGLLYLMPGSSLLTWGDPTLPSALRRFTSEFGMGSGGTTALVPPANSVLSTRLTDVSINLYQS